MSINRVPEVPFAQIANSALRDQRLSFKARGILAMVLSNVGEWRATAEWIEEQSIPDGRHAVQTALNELTEYGYRRVRKERLPDGQISTIVDWYHESQIIRPTENPTVGKLDHRETGPSLEDHSLEHHPREHDGRTIVRKPVDPDPHFEEFWKTYPRKAAKGAARRAWAKAVRIATPDDIIAGAARYAEDPHRDESFTAHPATWLNGERWLDSSLPARETTADRRVHDVMDVIGRAAARDRGEIEQ